MREADVLPMWYYAARRALPWVLGLIVLAVAGWQINGYGQRQYLRGMADVQAAWDKDRAAQTEAAAEAYRSGVLAGQLASSSYQEDKQHADAQTRTLRETVTRYVDRPVYRDVCLDDGLRDTINAAIAGGAADAEAAR